MSLHKGVMRDHNINQYNQYLQRVCSECGQKYTIGQYLQNSSHYFLRPWNYRRACETYCLECWLGVGSHDFPTEDNDDHREQNEALAGTDEVLAIENVPVEHKNHDNWPYEKVYGSLIKGDVLSGFQLFLDNGANLVIMPIARVNVDRVFVFPGAITFYPEGVADIDTLNLTPNRLDTTSLSEICAAASGITSNVLKKHPLVIFPCRFDWQVFRITSHKWHLDFIRQVSEDIDRRCLNLLRYKFCRLEPIDNLPAHAGQVASNPMMAGALVYSSEMQEARIIGGAAFTHYLTRGLGLSLQQLEWGEFPRDGEVGNIVNHALSLYAALLESDNHTSRFIQATSLLEFLAQPYAYLKFKEVKKVIARYVARDHAEYQTILDRFEELTSKKTDTDQDIGYRTNVVHMGKRIENLVPDHQALSQLFLELDGYIRPMIDHMISHSEMSFDDYLNVRNLLRPFER